MLLSIGYLKFFALLPIKIKNLMKFIHTSDWHIGRQFHSVSLLDDQRHVLDQIVAHIKNEAVDAVIIAGDIINLT